jgi:hypothetical protein
MRAHPCLQPPDVDFRAGVMCARPFEPLIEPSANDPGVIFLGECRRLVDQFLALG